ncbi:uncharacterized protein LOC132740776 [Ruditapes philippinarum]|uniref:uncharacterized protein LOC132740776 n=1 Tax=Ruditapes philippinarum TaxID=129788 RepID=UPI00295B067F|nr:uncharacterized protein LOC132740776 [Ruditapes philippinarum]
MEIHHYLPYNQNGGVMKISDGWENLKRKLDDDITQEVLDRIIFLIDDKIKTNPEIETVTDILNTLENSKSFEDVLSILEHVFGHMNNYPEYEDKSFYQLIRKCRLVKRKFGCSNIIGREKEIREAIKALESSDNNGLWIYGMGGLGKTLLANEISAQLHLSRKTAVIKLDLKQFKDAVELIKSLLEKFQVYSRNSETSASLTSQLLSQLEVNKQDTCIILDSIEDVYDLDHEEVIDFLHRCFATSTNMPIKWIITSRKDAGVKFDGLKEIGLGPLNDGSAEKLFKISTGNVEVLNEMHHRILQKTDNNPLAIRLVSSALNSYNVDGKFDNLSFLSSQLQTSMYECIEYAYMSLTESERAQLNLLTVVETSYFDIEIVKAVLEKDDEEALLILTTLINRQLVKRICYGRYCLHHLILDHIRNRPGYEECSMKAQNNFCQHMIERLEPYVQQADKDYSEAIALISSNKPFLKVLFNALSIRKKDSNHLLTSDVSKTLIRLQKMVPMTNNEKEILYRNITMQILPDGRHHANMYWKLEEIRMMEDNNRFTDAEKEISIIEETLRMIPEDNTSSSIKGTFWYIKGRFFRLKKVKQYIDAIECFKKSRSINKRIGNIPEYTEALDALGNTYYDMGDDETALYYHQKAFDILQKYTSDEFHPDLSVYEFNIGTIYFSKAVKEYSISKYVTKNAKEYFAKSIQIFERSLQKDKTMKVHKMQNYAKKLSLMAEALFYISNSDNERAEAVGIMKESLKIKNSSYTKPTRNKTLAIFKTGQAFLKWRRIFPQNESIKRDLLVEATSCFVNVINEIKSNSRARLDEKDTDHLCDILKRKILKAVSEKTCKSIKKFIQQCASDSSSESSSSLDHNDSDEDQNSSDNNDISSSDDGILCAVLEKKNAAQFQENFFSEISKMEVSGKVSRKRRQSFDSE